MTTKARDRYLRRKYGITEAEYDLLLVESFGLCWICGRKPTGRSLHVDHDHKLKGRASVRGLVCWHCNSLLAHARDSSDILNSAAEYLETQTAQEILDAAA